MPDGFSPEVVDAPIKSADVVMFGTLNEHLPGVKATDWMGNFTHALHTRNISVYNPNVEDSSQRNLKKESTELVNSKIIVMNFEGQGGGTSLAELRFAMLSAVLNKQKLFVNFEEPANDRAKNARQIASTDAKYMKELFGDYLDIEVTGDGEQGIPFDAEVFANKVKQVLETPREQHASEELPLQGSRNNIQYNFSLSGSSENPSLRKEIKEKLSQLGSVEDTHIEGWDDDIVGNRKKELDMMLTAKEQVVVVGKNSPSKLAHFMAAITVAYLNDGHVTGYIPQELMEKNDVKTILSHLRELGSIHPRMNNLYTLTADLNKIVTIPQPPNN